MLVKRLEDLLASGKPIATVDCAWTLLAAIAAREVGDADQLLALARARLLNEQGKLACSRTSSLPLRSVACAPMSRALRIKSIPSRGSPALGIRQGRRSTGGRGNMREADLELQGPAGQWWWHYDVRDGPSWRAILSTASINTQWRRWRCSICTKPAARTICAAVARGLNWLRGIQRSRTP